MLLKAEKLKKAILEHPDLPILFFCNSEIWGDWEFDNWPAASISVRIGKVLDPPDSDTFERTWTDEDEDEFESAVRDELDTMDETQGISDEEYEAMVQRELERYNRYWRDCIIVYLGA